MKVLQVTEDTFEAAWPHARPWIEKADAKGHSTYPVEDTARDIVHGSKKLFKCVSGDSFVWLVLGCHENSKNRTAVVYDIAGSGLLNMIDDVVAFCEAYGVTNGCQRITGHGRAGWIKELARFGWKEISRTCGKEL